MLLLLLLFSPFLSALPPPPGVILKPAKQLDEKEDVLSSSIPPNLSLRSRMMAAINSENPKNGRLIMTSQPLILKRKKLKAFPSMKQKKTTTKPPSSSTIHFPPSADYGVTSSLKTNFVDKKGRIHPNMISVPIRVGELTRVSASSSLVEGESAKGVQIRFGPVPEN